jgi:hypothetical protein
MRQGLFPGAIAATGPWVALTGQLCKPRVEVTGSLHQPGFSTLQLLTKGLAPDRPRGPVPSW